MKHICIIQTCRMVINNTTTIMNNMIINTIKGILIKQRNQYVKMVKLQWRSNNWLENKGKESNGIAGTTNKENIIINGIKDTLKLMN